MGLFDKGAEEFEQGVGDVIGGGARALGDGLSAVGFQGAGRDVQVEGNRLGSSLGGDVGELELGESEDPRELVHGDAGAIRAAASQLRRFFSAFSETADGLGRIETGHWEGAAADAFRARFSPEPAKWSAAAEATGRAAGALETYAGAVESAQAQARQAIELWGQAPPGHAAGQAAGGGEPREEARQLLATARRAREEAAASAAFAVRAGTNLAPAEPSLWSQIGGNVADSVSAGTLAAGSFGSGILGGIAGIGKFARSLTGEDPWNLAHPAEYAAGISGTLAGLVGGVMNPGQLVKGLIGSGWGSDPFGALGRLVPNVALAAVTDGGGAAADAGDAAAAIGEGEAENAGMNAASRTAEDRVPCEKGEPVDVATGDVVMTQADVSLPGALPLAVTRTHRSSQRGGRWFGESWVSALDQRVAVTDGQVAAVFGDGQVLLYPDEGLDAGEALPKAGPQWPLRKDADGSYTVTDPRQGLAWRYETRPGYWRGEDGQGELPLVSVTDRAGHAIGFEYDQDGQPSAVTHSGGYRVTVTVADGRVRALSLSGVALKSFEYDEHGQLAGVTDSSGQPQRLSYDAAGRLAGWTDRNGAAYRYAYDEHGRCVRGESPSGALSGSFEYRDGSTFWTDATGAVSEYAFDRAARLMAVTDPLGNTTRFERDHRNRVTARTDPLGRVTRYEYDEDGNLTVVIRPDGGTARAVYDDRGQAVELREADGSVRHQEFDDCGNVTAVTGPDGAVTRYAYDEAGHLAGVTGPDGAVTRVTCDGAGLPTSVAGPDGAAARYERDQFGREVRITGPSGGVTEMTWTVEGRPASRTLPDGSAETWQWDPEGNLARHVSPAGAVTSYEYGPFDKATAVTGPGGTRIAFAYDGELRQSAVTYSGLTWQYAYDAAGRVTSETDCNGAVTRYAYDAAGQLVARVNAVGQETAYAYDLLGKVVEQRSGEAVTSFAYDAAGRLVLARNPDATLELERDALGRVTAETCDGRTVATSYDAAGRVTGRVTPSGAATSWDYDAAGLPAVMRSGERELRFGYAPGGRETRRELPGGLTLGQDWDVSGRLSAQVLTGPGLPDPVQRRTYAYDADGFVTGIGDLLGGDRAFGLDAAGRVTSVTGAGWSEGYAYDAAGNIASAALPASPSGGVAPWGDSDPAEGREITGTLVRRAGSVHYRYDAVGRVTAKMRTRISRKPETWHYEWDADNRLTSATAPDKSVWRYAYDPLGRRVGKVHVDPSGRVLSETRFTWDGPTLAESSERIYADSASDEPTRESATTWEYRPGTFTPVAQSSSVSLLEAPQEEIDRRFHAIVTDLVGAPAELVAPDGTLAGHQQRTLWGTTVWDPSGESTPLRFPGQYADEETGLHYNNQRYYDPTTGAYLSPDPLGLSAGPNPHSYVSNPHVFLDPLGLLSCEAGSRYTDLYHATNSAGAESIRNLGVDPSYSPRPMDFGNGFYTTRLHGQAADWASRRFGSDGVVLHFRIPNDQLGGLSSRMFTENDSGLSEFVRHFRTGSGAEVPPHDMVEGPMLRNPRQFTQGAPPIWSGNQVVFYGENGGKVASMLNSAIQGG